MCAAWLINNFINGQQGRVNKIMKKYARGKEEGNGRLCVWKRVMEKEEKGGE